MLVIAGPPFATGLVQVTAAEPLPATAATFVGAAGAATVTVWSLNLSRSTLRIVSTPSLTFWPSTFSPLCVTTT